MIEIPKLLIRQGLDGAGVNGSRLPLKAGGDGVVCHDRLPCRRVGGHEDGAVVVDAVSEVHNVAKADLKPAPEFGGTLGTDSIRGLVTRDERMLIILDIDHLMNSGVLQALD